MKACAHLSIPQQAPGRDYPQDGDGAPCGEGGLRAPHPRPAGSEAGGEGAEGAGEAAGEDGARRLRRRVRKSYFRSGERQILCMSFFTSGDLVVVVGSGGVTVACEGGTGAMGPGGEIGA